VKASEAAAAIHIEISRRRSIVGVLAVQITAQDLHSSIGGPACVPIRWQVDPAAKGLAAEAFGSLPLAAGDRLPSDVTGHDLRAAESAASDGFASPEQSPMLRRVPDLGGIGQANNDCCNCWSI